MGEMVFLTIRELRHNQWKDQTVCFSKQREENNFSHGIKFTHGSHYHRGQGGKLVRGQGPDKLTGKRVDGWLQTQGAGKTTIVRWSMESALGAPGWEVAYAVLRLLVSVVRETHTQNTESQVDASSVTLALNFWVSQLGGIGLSWPVPADDTLQGNASAEKGIHFPGCPARCCLTRYISWWNVLF